MIFALYQALDAYAKSCQTQINFLLNKQLLYTFASSKVFPVAPVLEILSLPACNGN